LLLRYAVYFLFSMFVLTWKNFEKILFYQHCTVFQ
jgi:hypothetical protein